MKHTLKIGLLRLAKACGGFALARFLTRNGFAVLGWHGVSFDAEHLVLPEYFITEEQFEARLGFLEKHFRIVPLSDLVEQHACNQIRPRQVALTFDDGMVSFGTLAAPILEQRDLTATLYAVTARMNQPVGTRLAITHLLMLASDAAISRCAKVRENEASRRAQAIEHYANEISTLHASERRDYTTRLADELGVDFKPVLDARVWEHHSADELAELAARGFDIQVHSHEHRTVTEDPEGTHEAARVCREALETITQQRATDYCFPSGLWTRTSWPALMQAGMRSATTCRLGPNFSRTPPLALRRYIDHSGISQLEFEALVSGVPWLVHVLFHPSRWFVPSEAHTEDGTYY